MKRFRLATEVDVDAILKMMRGHYEEGGYAFSQPEAREAVFSLLHNRYLMTKCLDDPLVSRLA